MRQVLLFLVLAGCAGTTEPEPDAVDGLALDIGAAGPFHPGYRLLSLTYDPGVGDTPRTLDVHVWYPTESENFDEVAYTYDVFTDDAVVPDALPAAPIYDGTYPVHAYSHGDRGFGGSSAFLARYLATHGWVTVAPDHLDNLTFDTVEPKQTSHFIHRPLDISAALDLLEAEPELGGLADTSSVLLSGHSFGSYTTWAAFGGSYTEELDAFCAPENRDCTEAERSAFAAGLGDERIVATLPMAGTIRRGWFGDSGHASVGGPVFFLSGTEDPVGQQDQWDAMDAIDFTWVDIEGACHHAFALGGCFELETAEGHAIIQTYGLAFARATVLGDDSVSGVLDGTEVISERAAFLRKLPD